MGWTSKPAGRVETAFTTRWSLSLWHESFIPLNSVRGAQEGGFNQGRFFAGVQCRVSRRVTVEPGYLALFNYRGSPFASDWDRAINVGVLVRF